MFFFFFQAEDGIRDFHVTGVQTCALPILILLFCVIGVYSESSNVWDIVVMLAFGVLGLLMKRFGFEAAPLVLAFVLGRMAEESIRQALLMSGGRLSILLTRPLATAFVAAALIVVVLPVA